jgi:hypothetical protein
MILKGSQVPSLRYLIRMIASYPLHGMALSDSFIESELEGTWYSKHDNSELAHTSKARCFVGKSPKLLALLPSPTRTQTLYSFEKCQTAFGKTAGSILFLPKEARVPQ